MSEQKIIEVLTEAVAGKLARVWIDGQLWVRSDKLYETRAQLEAYRAAAKALPQLMRGYRYSLMERYPPAMQAGFDALAALRAAGIQTGE